jgi:hypothetical protein
MVKDCDKTTLEVTAGVHGILVCLLVPPLRKNPFLDAVLSVDPHANLSLTAGNFPFLT